MFHVRGCRHTREPAGRVHVSCRHHRRRHTATEALGEEPIPAGLRRLDHGGSKPRVQAEGPDKDHNPVESAVAEKVTKRNRGAPGHQRALKSDAIISVLFI